MSQCSQFNDMIKKMSKFIVDAPEVKLLCHFDGNLTDSSVYTRAPIIVGAGLSYKTGGSYAPFTSLYASYAVSILGTSTAGKRHDGYIGYDISDVDLSGSFCIDYFYRPYGTTYGHHPMALIPLGVEDTTLYHIQDSPLRHYDDTSTTTGSYTYNPATQQQEFVKMTRYTSGPRHVAVTRDENNVLRWFYNGTLVSSSTNSYNFTSKEIQLARTYSNGTGARLYVDELRLVSGSPCYTENFTPPTKPHTLIVEE